MTQCKQTDKNVDLELYRSEGMKKLNDKSLCQVKDNIIKLISMENIKKMDFSRLVIDMPFGKKTIVLVCSSIMITY